MKDRPSYELPGQLAIVDEAAAGLIGLLELLADSTDDEAVWRLVDTLTDARLAWARAHDITGDDTP